MIRYKKDLQEIAISGECDRCGRKLPKDSPEFYERISILYQAGYESVFVDGNHVECDLCQHCVKGVFGPWLKTGVTHKPRWRIIQDGKWFLLLTLIFYCLVIKRQYTSDRLLFGLS